MLAGVAFGCAQEPRLPAAAITSREQVIDAYGWPTGQSKSGAREILIYPQGRVILENGLVENIDFPMKPPWPPPRPRPDWAAAALADKPAATTEIWRHRFEHAAREATQRHLRILALFTDPEATHASRQFDDDVATHPEFIDAFAAEFVFFRLDFAARAPVPAEVREQHHQLRERHEVTTYPTLLLLSPAGDRLATVDLSKAPPGERYRAEVIAAVRAAREQAAVQTSGTGAATDAPAAPPPVSPEKRISAKTIELMLSLFRAERMVAWALTLGAITAAILLWLVWRRWGSSRSAPEGEMALRISDAASGLPSQQELLTWPRERLAALMAALAETEGHQAELQPAGGDQDIVLRRAAGEKPQVLVLCAGSEIGVVSVKRVREFFATMTAEGVDTGWFVAPAGFAAEAKSFAVQHRVQLIDGPELAGQLRDLPPLMVPKVVAKAAATRRRV